MKRAIGAKIHPGRTELDVFADDVHDIEFGFYFI